MTTASSFMKATLVTLMLIMVALTIRAQEATIRKEGNSWILSTDKVERTVTLNEGRLFTTSWVDRISGRNLLANTKSDELSAVINGHEVSGRDGGWKLVSFLGRNLKDGSLQCDLTVERDDVKVTKSYVLYPGSSIVREWVSFTNVGSQPMTIEDPSFLTLVDNVEDLSAADFDWMTGGMNVPGSWMLKTEPLTVGHDRHFDSYDAFPGRSSSEYGAKMGSSDYAPWFSLYNRKTRQGIFLGYDYFGHWSGTFSPTSAELVRIQFKVAGYRMVLAPGKSLSTPKAFTGLYRDDLDNAGNECLDWQYRYLWDYTRPDWFPAIRILGWWAKGTRWRQPGWTWVGGEADWGSTFRKVFRVADLMSELGGDVYHRDWGWWDRAGDWNGPDFKTTGKYLSKHAMGQLIYAPLYTVDSDSHLAREHPDWIIPNARRHMQGGTLDMSKPAVVSYMEQELDIFRQRFGPFEWRNDSVPTAPHGSDDTPLLAQDQNFREILRYFLDQHPDCAFQGVNGGGNELGYDYARYASSLSFSDGQVGFLLNYWESLLIPPDKSSDIPDIWQPDLYNKDTWRGLLVMNFDLTGDTWDPAKLDGVRELIDIYHYLGSQGVVGRWVHVYRPIVKGDDPTMYFERLSRNAQRGIIVTKRPFPEAVTIRPKGLEPEQDYLVSYQESAKSERRKGKDLMTLGIHLDKVNPGELIYLNLPYHPGSKFYRSKPSAPEHAQKRVATNMGYPGVELTWIAAHDAHWVSYYEILRDGVILDKVAKGTYYFDHSAGADLAAQYTIRTVNGGGLRSSETQAFGLNGVRATILDDAAPQIHYWGSWQRMTNLQPVYKGTLTKSEHSDAYFAFEVNGKQFTWFTQMCAECGMAQVTVDDRIDDVVDTYSADDVFGVGIYNKQFATSGPHKIRILVLGKRDKYSKGTFIYNDGIQVGH